MAENDDRDVYLRAPRQGDEVFTRVIDAVQTSVVRQVLELIATSASQQELDARSYAFEYFNGGEKDEGRAQQARLALARRDALKAVESRVKTVRFKGEVPGMKP